MKQETGKSRRIFELLKKTERETLLWDINKMPIGEGYVISFLNAHAINMAFKNSDFYEALISNRFLLRDGIGAKIAMKLFGLTPGQNLNGTDLISRIVPKMTDKRIAIYGASSDALTALNKRLRQEGVLNIIDLQHGFHEFDVYLSAATEKNPDLIILCMGMPKQELLATKLHQAFPDKVIICGGGWADFYSETKTRAPLWVRKLSLEWVFRLCHEPKRLGKRYTIDIIYFFYVILLARIRN